MELKITGIELFKPNGETREIPGEEIEMMNYNEERNTLSIYLRDGTAFDTNMPYMVHFMDEEREYKESGEGG